MTDIQPRGLSRGLTNYGDADFSLYLRRSFASSMTDDTTCHRTNVDEAEIGQIQPNHQSDADQYACLCPNSQSDRLSQHSADTGSSAFVPLLHYVLSNEVQAILSQGGHQLVVHTIVTGGQALLDTLHGAAQLVKQMDAARFVIWLNPFWGPVADNGRTFEQMNLYEAIKKRIETIVSLPAFTDELFPQDTASMLKSRLRSKKP